MFIKHTYGFNGWDVERILIEYVKRNDPTLNDVEMICEKTPAYVELSYTEELK